MGCDGGTIPKRDELVRTKKKPEQKDKNAELAFKWKHCAISQEVLVKPIVACELGRLYNKEAVLEFLLDRSKFEVAAQFDHLRGLKDIKEMNLTDNPESRPRDAEKGDGFIDHSISDFICPIVGLEMSGKYKFCLLWSCGCVLSERAIKEVKTETCHKCGKKFSEDDVVVLNGTDEEVVEMREKMDKRRALFKTSKKSKKADKHKLTDLAVQVTSTQSKKTCLDTESSAASTSSSAPLTTAASTSSSAPLTTAASTSSSALPTTAAPLSNGTKCKVQNGFSKVSKSSNGQLPADKRQPKEKSSLSIQKDPKASKTFKSLFTTSEAAKTQKQAHWVTYNPMYF